MTPPIHPDKLILFDFDGVLADSLAYYEESMRRTLQLMGQPVINSRAEYLDLFEENLYDALLKKGLDLEKFFAASAAIQKQYPGPRLEPFPGLIPIVKELSGRCLLSIISSNGSSTIRDTLTRHDFLDCFGAIMGADFGFSKIEKIKSVISLNHADKKTACYVGDTAGDIREARQAGVKTVAVTWGWHSRERLLRAEPDYLIDNPRELLLL